MTNIKYKYHRNLLSTVIKKSKKKYEFLKNNRNNIKKHLEEKQKSDNLETNNFKTYSSVVTRH